MNKDQLVGNVAERLDAPKAEVKRVLDAMVEELTSAVQDGDRVSLPGFGTFERRERAARTGRNPQTGASINVAASKAPAFKPAKAFKDAVNT